MTRFVSHHATGGGAWPRMWVVEDRRRRISHVFELDLEEGAAVALVAEIKAAEKSRQLVAAVKAAASAAGIAEPWGGFIDTSLRDGERGRLGKARRERRRKARREVDALRSLVSLVGPKPFAAWKLSQLQGSHPR